MSTTNAPDIEVYLTGDPQDAEFVVRFHVGIKS